jgi:hypothetical protein
MAHTTLVRAAVQTLLGVVLVSGLGAVPTASATRPADDDDRALGG